ncbi:MAG: hypothetical protein H6822_31085 [Planctomycetaceae bacterium]|nr:hypothetical protein [Planctomycetales bacterium]MCB9926625.1 hypothetical protein [Planctomycetaceae bacterium]
MAATTKTAIEEVAMGQLFLQAQRQIVSRAAAGKKPVSKMYLVDEGVMEEHADQSFVASLQTEDGLKKVHGHVGDVQSIGQMTSWKASVERIKSAIRHTATSLPADRAISEIGKVWEQVDGITQLAEARTRICLGMLPPPALTALPDNLVNQIEELRNGSEDLGPSHAFARDSAEKLLRACISIGEENDAEVQVFKAPLGHVAVEWQLNNKVIQWEVQPAKLPWPGVTVRVLVLEQTNAGIPIPHARVFHNAFDVIQHFQQESHGAK